MKYFEGEGKDLYKELEAKTSLPLQVWTVRPGSGPCFMHGLPVRVLLRQGGLFRAGSLAGRCVCSVTGSVLV